MTPLRRIAFIGNSLPRRCGIATFTTDLERAVSNSRPNVETCIVAMNDHGQTYDYPKSVAFQIKDDTIDDYVRAAPILNECLTLCREIGDTPTIMHALEVFGFIADEFDQSAPAVEFYAAAARLRKQLGLPMSPRGQAYVEEMLVASRGRLGDETFDRLWKSGTESTLEQTLALVGQIRVPAEATAPGKAE